MHIQSALLCVLFAVTETEQKLIVRSVEVKWKYDQIPKEPSVIFYIYVCIIRDVASP